MKTSMRVTFSWTSFKQKNLPSNGRYVTVAKFDDETESLLGAWSVVLEFNAQDVLKDKIDGYAHFLADEDAPKTLLVVGRSFTLIEGNKITANVTVVGSAVREAPDEAPDTRF